MGGWRGVVVGRGGVESDRRLDFVGRSGVEADAAGFFMNDGTDAAVTL